jgi:hypothetical protein
MRTARSAAPTLAGRSARNRIHVRNAAGELFAANCATSRHALRLGPLSEASSCRPLGRLHRRSPDASANRSTVEYATPASTPRSRRVNTAMQAHRHRGRTRHLPRCSSTSTLVLANDPLGPCENAPRVDSESTAVQTRLVCGARAIAPWAYQRTIAGGSKEHHGPSAGAPGSQCEIARERTRYSRGPNAVPPR